MQYQRQFSINLDQQKRRAKKRLKAIKAGDKSALEQVQQFQSNPEQLTIDTIKLADVQFAIARELGLPSWSKLKAHANELAQHRQAINNDEPPLDAGLKTLHVRCGHDIQQTLRQCGFQGTFLPMIDPLCMGPIPDSEQDFVSIRAKYVVDTLFTAMGNDMSVEHIVKSEQENIDTLLSNDFERIVFWVEHDSYDQFMLLRALNLLENESNRIIEIIELNSFPGSIRFIGLGQLPAEAVRSCWKNRKPISAKLMSQAKTAWAALRANTPEALMGLIQQHSLDCLPNLANVIERHLKELPHKTMGLSFTQYLGLSVLKVSNKPITFKQWFNEYQQAEPLPFLGDSMFLALMLPLSRVDNPLFSINDPKQENSKPTYEMTDHGLACLAGEARVEQSYWVGGICVDG